MGHWVEYANLRGVCVELVNKLNLPILVATGNYWSQSGDDNFLELRVTNPELTAEVRQILGLPSRKEQCEATSEQSKVAEDTASWEKQDKETGLIKIAITVYDVNDTTMDKLKAVMSKLQNAETVKQLRDLKPDINIDMPKSSIKHTRSEILLEQSALPTKS